MASTAVQANRSGVGAKWEQSGSTSSASERFPGLGVGRKWKGELVHVAIEGPPSPLAHMNPSRPAHRLPRARRHTGLEALNKGVPLRIRRARPLRVRPRFAARERRSDCG